jgi:hypothetical protein
LEGGLRRTSLRHFEAYVIYTPSMKSSQYDAPQSSQSRQEIILMGRIERSSGWLFPAFITVFWFGALFVALMTSEKTNNRVLIFALLVGVVFIVNLLRKLNIMSLLAFERRAVLVLPPSFIKAGDDFEILFRQELKRNHTVISVDATLYGEIVDNRSTEIEYRIPHIQKTCCAIRTGKAKFDDEEYHQ